MVIAGSFKSKSTTFLFFPEPVYDLVNGKSSSSRIIGQYFRCPAGRSQQKEADMEGGKNTHQGGYEGGFPGAGISSDQQCVRTIFPQ